DYDVNGTWDQSRYTNWQKELIGGVANLSNIRYTLSGGDQLTSFLVGTGISRETSVMTIDASEVKRNASVNLIHGSINEKFNLQFFGNYSVNNSTLPRLNPLRSALTLPPNAPQLYDDNGNLNWE